jgi:acyl-CoA synthetase (AMP-forming)/AMP-acid ligase II
MYMTQGLRRVAKITPDKTALISKNVEFTWAEFLDRVARLAGALHGLAMKTEDRVAMLSFNSHRYAEYYYGVFWAGANVVPMNIRWSLAEHVYSIKDSGARFLIVDDAFVEMGGAIARECASIEHVIFAGDGACPSGMLAYEDLIADAPLAEDAFRNGEDLAGIFYTGGTTGFPKGVMLPHRALWASTFCFAAGAEVTPEDRMIHAPPMFHIAGSAMLFSATLFGASHGFIPGFEAKAFLDAVTEFDGTITLLVPTMVAMLLQSPELDAADTSKLTRLLYGASPMTLTILKEAMEKMPETRFIHAYGQTELAPLVTLLGSDYHVLEGPKADKIRSVGQAVPSVEIEIVDADGVEVPRNQPGEVRVRGANAMLGYWNKPEQSAETLRDGWVYTGDGGVMDEDGFIYIVDRVKDMIITGGENVYSAEVENAIMRFPGLAECAVIGIPDEKWGEAVHAVVVPRDGQSPEAEAIITHCRGLIAGYKCPRTVEVRVEALPKSGAGKIQKFELRAPFWKGRDRGVS